MNKDLAIEKGLIVNDDLKLYKSIENIYKKIFEKEILSKVNLLKYDDLLKNSELDFGISHPTEKQLISGLDNYLGLNFIFGLNNFFVEKLSIDELKTLEQMIDSDTIDKNAIEIVKRTYKEVLKNNYSKGVYVDEKYKIVYGYAIPSNFVDNDSLVLKIFYTKSKRRMPREEFFDNLKKKKKFLTELKEQIENEVFQVLGIGCTVLIEDINNRSDNNIHS